MDFFEVTGGFRLVEPPARSGYIAEKTNPGALAYGPAGSEEVLTLFRKI